MTNNDIFKKLLRLVEDGTYDFVGKFHSEFWTQESLSNHVINCLQDRVEEEFIRFPFESQFMLNGSGGTRNTMNEAVMSSVHIEPARTEPVRNGVLRIKTDCTEPVHNTPPRIEPLHTELVAVEQWKCRVCDMLILRDQPDRGKEHIRSHAGEITDAVVELEWNRD